MFKFKCKVCGYEMEILDKKKDEIIVLPRHCGESMEILE